MAYLILFVIGIVSARTVSPEDKDNINALREPKEIRCFCNMPDCVGTNYMCKSNSLGCFSDLLPSMDVDKAGHGCIDLLPREKNAECQNVPGGTGGGTQGSLLLCCYQDMCNHIDSPEARSKYNETVHASLISGSTDEALMLKGATGTRTASGYNTHELWFIATIAVPILGALILLILILLAVKILKSDPQALPPKFRTKGGSGTTSLLSGVVVAHNPSTDTGCVTSKKLPLLFHQNDCSNFRAPDYSAHQVDKNEAHAKLNTPGSDLIDISKPGGHSAPTCNLYQPLLSPQQLSGHHHNNLYGKEVLIASIEDKPWLDTAEVVGKLMQEYSSKFHETYPKTNFCNSYSK